MWKKFSVLLFALLLFLAANLNVGWKISVNDTLLPGCYSSRQIKESTKIAHIAAEEISRFHSSAPELRKSLRLSFRPASADSRVLNDYMLLYSGGIELADGVFVNGVQLGTVESGTVLSEKLRDYIRNQMPNVAVFGSISGKMLIRPVFSTVDHYTNYDDMILLVSGMAPVFYVDKNGHIA